MLHTTTKLHGNWITPGNKTKEIKPTIPSIKQLMNWTKIPLDEWHLKVQVINECITDRRPLLGRIRSGLCLIPPNEHSVMHGYPYVKWHWIDMGDGLVVDPCSWILTLTRPVVSINASDYYDANWEKIRQINPDIAPPPDPRSPVVRINFSSGLSQRIRELLLGCELTHENQLRWLVKLPKEFFGVYGDEFIYSCVAAGYLQLFSKRTVIPVLTEMFPDDNKGQIHARYTKLCETRGLL